MQPTISPLCKSDLDELHPMYLQVIRDSRAKWGNVPLYPWPMESTNLQRYIAGIERSDPRYHAAIARNEENKIVGYTRAIHRADKAFTTYHTIAIRADFRKSGLFDALTFPVLREAAAQGKTIQFSVNANGPLEYYQQKWGAKEGFRKVTKHVGTIVYMSFDPKEALVLKNEYRYLS